MNNREIKFRAWDKENKYMIGADTIFDQIDCDGISVFDMAINNDSYILMQYTGLKDKNGIEIYEGDIIKGKLGDDYITWEVYYEAPKFNGCDFIGEIEVIGNIYQSKHLLDNTDTKA